MRSINHAGRTNVYLITLLHVPHSLALSHTRYIDTINKSNNVASARALRAAIKLIAHTASHRDTRRPHIHTLDIIKWALFIKTPSSGENIFQLASQFIFISPLFIYSGRESVFVYYSVDVCRCSQPHGTCPHTTSTYVLLHLAVVNLWPQRASCMNANLLAPQVQSYVKKVGALTELGPTKDWVYFLAKCVCETRAHHKSRLHWIYTNANRGSWGM
jgi:hypothetical protein